MKKKYSINQVLPKKSLGQNFLINQGVVNKIVGAAELKSDDTVIEIGPGTGVLTAQLSKSSGRVISIEKDHRLIEQLRNEFKNTNVEIVEDDILEFKPKTLGLEPGTYKAIGNIPYYLTSHLLRKIFEDWPKPELVVLTIQKEVAQRIIATEGMNILSLSVQLYSEPKIISYVSKGSFRPIPKVDSAIIKLIPRKESLIKDEGTREMFFALIKKAFAGKRKQLKNTVDNELLKKAGIKPESRPEELSLKDWVRIAENSLK